MKMVFDYIILWSFLAALGVTYVFLGLFALSLFVEMLRRFMEWNKRIWTSKK